VYEGFFFPTSSSTFVVNVLVVAILTAVRWNQKGAQLLCMADYDGVISNGTTIKSTLSLVLEGLLCAEF
jgi:hypothetical protein